MKTVRLRGENIHHGSLLLVNSSCPLKVQPAEDSMAAVDYGEMSVLLERQAARILAKTLSENGGDGQIVAVSGFRTMHEQQRIYNDSLRDNGEDFTRRFVALPGCSEHQTGLAVDMAENTTPVDFIRPSFPYTCACQRFREKAVDYGFIERYPAGHECVTHIAHEPWHFRYVGYPHSRIMTDEARALEQYTDYLKQFIYHKQRLKFRDNGLRCEIGFIPLQPDDAVEVEVPEHTAYQLSGNNVDGVIATLWNCNP